MKIRFLGTGAADWSGKTYGEGEFFRRRSSALIDDGLLIDPGPDIFDTGVSLACVTDVIVTHTHSDHFSPQVLARLCENRAISLWGDDACLRALEKAGGVPPRLMFHPTEIGKTYEIGGYTVTPLRANHRTPDEREVPRVYLVERDGRTLFYGCDSAWLPCDTWKCLKEVPVNLMVLELTCGATAVDDWRIFEHNDRNMLASMIRMFRKYGCFAPDVRYVTSHMARTLHADHETLASDLARIGVTPAYDLLELDV